MREILESGEVKEKLVQKLEAYLRAHFDYESVEGAREGEVEKLLLDVAYGWCANRGLPGGRKLAASACREALSRYRRNWEGKKQGEDDRSHALGRMTEGYGKEYAL